MNLIELSGLPEDSLLGSELVWLGGFLSDVECPDIHISDDPHFRMTPWGMGIDIAMFFCNYEGFYHGI